MRPNIVFVLSQPIVEELNFLLYLYSTIQYIFFSNHFQLGANAAI